MTGVVNSTGARSGNIGTITAPAVGTGTDGYVFTGTGAGANPAWEATVSAGINSPYEHIGTYATSSDVGSGAFCTFQGVFSEEYSMYRIIIPYFNGQNHNDNLYMRFMSGDIDSTALSISAPTTTTGQVTGANYRMMSLVDGSDDGTLEQSDRTEISETAFILWNNLDTAVSSPTGGIRGYIDVWNPHKTKVWDKPTDAQISVSRGSNYGPTCSWDLFGYEATTHAESTSWTGTGYYNVTLADDHFTGFSIYAENGSIREKTIVHLLGLKLDLTTS